MTQAVFTIVKPIAVTPAMRLSTNVADEALPAWVAKNYVLGDQVVSDRAIWECKQAGNSATAPVKGDPLWLRVRAVNSWAALDRQKLTPTRHSGTATYVFKPGEAISAFAAINLEECRWITVRMVDPDFGEVYNQTHVVGEMPIGADWHSFLIMPWEWADDSQGFFLDLPTFPNAELHIEFVGTAGLEIGAMLFGMARQFGAGINWGLELGLKDYSSKEADKYSEVEIVERFAADTVDSTPVIYTSEMTLLHRYLKGLRATPALYIHVAEQASTNVYALFQDMRIVMSNKKYSQLSIRLESLL
ncbi:MAG: hypothetical protein ACN6O3_21195 [Comamonas sp.]